MRERKGEEKGRGQDSRREGSRGLDLGKSLGFSGPQFPYLLKGGFS